MRLAIVRGWFWLLSALSLGACAVPLAWTPPPPAGHGYEYRFSGVYEKSAVSGSDTTRFGRLRFTSYYDSRSRNISEVDTKQRLWTELPRVGSEADGRFNEHLGGAGQRLKEQP